MAIATEDINFDMHVHDNMGFAQTDLEDRNDNTLKTGNDAVAESSFNISDLKKKLSPVNCKAEEELKTIIAICIFFGVTVTIALIVTIYLGPPQVIPHGAVVSNTLKCSEIGIRILKIGGSAVDCAVTTAICEAALNLNGFGLTGSGILILHNQRSNSTDAIDFSCSTSHKKKEKQSVEIPTLLKGLAMAHNKHGLLEWKDLLQPVIDLLKSNASVSDAVLQLYTDIANEGIDSFYKGDVAQEIIETANNDTVKNFMTLQDLASYKPHSNDFIRFIYRGFAVETLSGLAGTSAILVLNILDSLTSSGKLQWNATDYYHYFIESVKVVEMEMRSGNASAVFASEEKRRLYVEHLASLIPAEVKVNESQVRHRPDEDLEASLISIIGPADDLVSLSVWHSMNQTLITEPHEIVLEKISDNLRNNTENEEVSYMEDFMCVVVHNLLKPCGLRFAITGSNYLNVVQVIINHLRLGMNITEAVEAPRLYFINGKIYHTDIFPSQIIQMLEAKKHSNLVEVFTSNSTLDTNIRERNVVRIVWKENEDVNACGNPEEISYRVF